MSHGLHRQLTSVFALQGTWYATMLWNSGQRPALWSGGETAKSAKLVPSQSAPGDEVAESLWESRCAKLLELWSRNLWTSTQQSWQSSSFLPFLLSLFFLIYDIYVRLFLASLADLPCEYPCSPLGFPWVARSSLWSPVCVFCHMQLQDLALGWVEAPEQSAPTIDSTDRPCSPGNPSHVLSKHDGALQCAEAGGPHESHHPNVVTSLASLPFPPLALPSAQLALMVLLVRPALVLEFLGLEPHLLLLHLDWLNSWNLAGPLVCYLREMLPTLSFPSNAFADALGSPCPPASLALALPPCHPRCLSLSGQSWQRDHPVLHSLDRLRELHVSPVWWQKLANILISLAYL